MNEQKTLLAKATTEQVEQLDAMVKKMGLIKESDYCEFYEEYNDLILSYDWSDIVFEENGKKGLMNVKGDVVVPAIYDDFSDLAPYYEYPKMVIAYLDGKAALVKRDGKGTPITEFEFTHVERISFSPFYAVCKEDKSHFALLYQGKVITPYELETYDAAVDGGIVLGANGKRGLLYYVDQLLYIKPEYDNVYDEGVGSDFFFVKDGVEGRLTMDGRFIPNEVFDNLTDEEYDELWKVGWLSAADF